RAAPPDNFFVSFLEQLQRQMVFRTYVPEILEEGQRYNDECRRDLQGLLGQLDEPLRTMRIDDAQALCLHVAADRERAIASGVTVISFELFADALLDGITGFLAAPASEAT